MVTIVFTLFNSISIFTPETTRAAVGLRVCSIPVDGSVSQLLHPGFGVTENLSFTTLVRRRDLRDAGNFSHHRLHNRHCAHIRHTGKT